MNTSAPVVFRLSPLQKTLWSNPDLRAGHVFGRVAIEGQLDLERLRNCFSQLAERHESLRTTFQVSPGFTYPFQVVGETPNFSWDVIETDSAKVEDSLARAAWPPSNPLEGPTFGVRVAKVSANRNVLGLRALGLCCDHVSLANMIAEVAGLYAGRDVEEAVQYADFSEWHNEALNTASEDSAAAKEFWAAAPSVQALPLASRGVASAAAAAAGYDFEVAAAASTAPFLLTCWQTTLWRLTNQDTVTLDVLSDGRPLDDLELSVGLFARPFPVGISFEGRPTFAAAQQATVTALSQVESWQAYCPVESSGTVGFEFLKLPETIAAGSVSFTVISLEPLRWPSRLALSCQSSGDTQRFRLLFDATQYAVNDVARIASYFKRVAQAAAANASAPASSYELLDSTEREQVVRGFNADSVDFHEPRLFPQLFEQQAALTPDSIALVFERSELTYAQLNARANQVAGWLRKNGVGANTPVGLCLERSAEMIVALLGIVKAGGAYVPLLPDLPAGRLQHQIAETGLTIIVSVEALLDRLAAFSGRTLCLDRDCASLDEEPTADLALNVTGDDLIYVLYTSGSTGLPKGVEVRHRNVANYIHGIVRRLGLEELSAGAGLTFATVSTLGADLGNTSIYPPLVTGGTLAVISYESALDGALFAERNREHPIDVLKITPSNLNALLSSEAAVNILPRKMLITGGEACTWDLARRVLAAGKCSMLNHYGPTEATIGCLTYNIPDDIDTVQAGAGIVPLGRPIPNLQAYILDAMLQPVPVGVPGEICISGEGITAGYLARPGETAARFVPHPFLAEGSALYRSGDLGRFLVDGNVEFLGRVDDQVKIRGHRVELTEIEAKLNQCAGVQHSAVLLMKDDAGDFLCAYLIASVEAPASSHQEYLRQYLPDYMVPREFVVVDQFPLNANGKIDRRKLAELKSAGVAVQADLIAPRTELEEQLVAIWKDTLRIERVGVRDNFFDLGGHSLLATQIISRIRSTLGLSVSIRMLFEAPTVESLAEAIETTRVVTTDDSDMGDLLAELEGLSDAEAEEILGGQ